MLRRIYLPEEEIAGPFQVIRIFFIYLFTSQMGKREMSFSQILWRVLGSLQNTNAFLPFSWGGKVGRKSRILTPALDMTVRTVGKCLSLRLDVPRAILVIPSRQSRNPPYNSPRVLSFWIFGLSLSLCCEWKLVWAQTRIFRVSSPTSSFLLVSSRPPEVAIVFETIFLIHFQPQTLFERSLASPLFLFKFNVQWLSMGVFFAYLWMMDFNWRSSYGSFFSLEIKYF